MEFQEKKNSTNFQESSDVYNRQPKIEYDEEDWGDDDDGEIVGNTNNNGENKNESSSEFFAKNDKNLKDNIFDRTEEKKKANGKKVYCSSLLGNGKGSEKLCSNLICTLCDCRVSVFEGSKWEDEKGVDYLFFRNNFACPAKLATKLRKEKNSNAYCCQCSWASFSSPTKRENWTCAGHWE